MLKYLFLLVCLFASFSVSAANSDVARESVGDLVGVLSPYYWLSASKKPMISQESNQGTYYLMTDKVVKFGVVESEHPLIISSPGFLSVGTGDTCFLDKNYRYEEAVQFYKMNEGSKLKFLNVDKIYKNGRLWTCTFKNFEILATKTQLKAEHDKKNTEAIVNSTPGVSSQAMSESLEFYEGTIDLTKVPTGYIEETSSIYSSCQKTKQKIFQDCKCYASEFLQERIKKGEHATQNSLMIALRDSCKNVEGTTNQKYQSCMGESMDAASIGQNITQKDFCECVADEWRDVYKNYQGERINSPSLQREWSFSAIMACKKKLSQP